MSDLRKGVEGSMSAGPPGPTMAVSEHEIPGSHGFIPARLYRPSAPAHALVVYFHGGGFVLGSITGYDATCRRLAAAMECAFLSIDYRLAPESPFPAGVNDAWSALLWASSNRRLCGDETMPLVVMGDSAGATLATVVARRSVAARLSVSAQVLVYPVVDARMDSPTYREFESGPFLTAAHMRHFWRLYLDGADGENPEASPLLAEAMRGEPAAIVVSAEIDPLRHEVEAYAQKLASAGVPVVAWREAGLAHGALVLAGVVDDARRMIDRIATELTEILRAPSSPHARSRS